MGEKDEEQAMSEWLDKQKAPGQLQKESWVASSTRQNIAKWTVSDFG